jgi:hypothetical protein
MVKCLGNTFVFVKTVFTLSMKEFPKYYDDFHSRYPRSSLGNGLASSASRDVVDYVHFRCTLLTTVELSVEEELYQLLPCFISKAVSPQYRNRLLEDRSHLIWQPRTASSCVALLALEW